MSEVSLENVSNTVSKQNQLLCYQRSRLMELCPARIRTAAAQRKGTGADGPSVRFGLASVRHNCFVLLSQGLDMWFTLRLGSLGSPGWPDLMGILLPPAGITGVHPMPSLTPQNFQAAPGMLITGHRAGGQSNSRFLAGSRGRPVASRAALWPLPSDLAKAASVPVAAVTNYHSCSISGSGS